MKNKIPLRKCVITNEQLPKYELFRIVKTKEGNVLYDPTGKQNGRGVYIKKDIEVINIAKSKLNKILNANIDIEIYDTMIKDI